MALLCSVQISATQTLHRRTPRTAMQSYKDEAIPNTERQTRNLPPYQMIVPVPFYLKCEAILPAILPGGLNEHRRLATT
jgi:hypothetical protein